MRRTPTTACARRCCSPPHDVESAKRLIDRGLRSDETWPEGKAYLMNTSDSGRNVRAETYERVKAVLGPAYPIEQVDADALEGKSDIMFEFTGVARVAAMTSNSSSTAPWPIT